LPNALLASTVQTAREDIPYSPFPVTQSMPTKYSNMASSIGGPTINMSEVHLLLAYLNSPINKLLKEFDLQIILILWLSVFVCSWPNICLLSVFGVHV
jgi:hypothetical protein